MSVQSGPIRSRYEKCKAESEQLQEQLDGKQAQVDACKQAMEAMRGKMGVSSVKHEALLLLEQLHVAEQKREQLREDARTVLTPDEERKKLLAQIKDNNQEISSMEKQ